MNLRSGGSCTWDSIVATDSSRNSNLARLSANMVARLSALDEGASGATAAPARRAPRNTAAYSMHDGAQIAIDSPQATASRWSEAATRSINASSSPKLSVRSSWIRAGAYGRSCACARTNSAMRPKSCCSNASGGIDISGVPDGAAHCHSGLLKNHFNRWLVLTTDGPVQVHGCGRRITWVLAMSVNLSGGRCASSHGRESLCEHPERKHCRKNAPLGSGVVLPGDSR
jgi:hypothetical protein